ncbi:MAG: S-layer homology domain-containing protein [Actinobacteria bacterium]|nr:S-layer homology domain-containing protein [Actinomycetota bacterium]
MMARSAHGVENFIRSLFGRRTQGVSGKGRAGLYVCGLIAALVGVLMGMFAAPAPALAGWVVREVTINADYAYIEDIDPWLVALAGGQRGNKEIFLYEFSTGRQYQVTNNSWDDEEACLAEAGVYWAGGSAGNREIYYAPFGTLQNTRITNDNLDDFCPKAAGPWVFWVHDDGHDLEIMARNMVDRTTKQLTNNIYDDGDLSILSFDGRYAAWHRYYDDTEDSDVLVCDTWDPALPIMRLYDDTKLLGFCQAGGGRVVMMRWWETGGKEYSDIWSYTPDAAQGQRWQQLSTADPPSFFPVPFLGEVTDGLYTIYLQEKGQGNEVKLADNVTGKVVTLSRYTYNDYPQYQDGMAIWESRVDGEWQLFAHEMATGKEIQLTDTVGVYDRWPRTSNGRVCWTEPHEDGTTSLFIAELLGTGLVFEDVRAGHQYGEAIEGLFRQGVVSGTREDGGLRWFSPENVVLRAQFAKMVCGTLGIEVDPRGTSPFQDLGWDDPNNLYPHQFIAAAYQWGITTGTSATSFSPWQDITRAQVISMLVRGAQTYWPDYLAQPPANYAGSTLGKFDNTHGWNVWVAEYNGLLNGLQGFGPSWNPWAKATRGEVAQMMWNLLVW